MCSVYLVTLLVISLGKVFFDSLPARRASVLARGHRVIRLCAPFSPSFSSRGKEVEVLRKQGGEEHIVFGLLFTS